MHATKQARTPDRPMLSSQAPKWASVNPCAYDAIQNASSHPDTQLAWLFFVFFSRFEYALKRHPRYLNKGNPAKPSADWAKFASENNKSFHTTDCPQMNAAIKYFHESPPKKQLVKSHSLDWGDLMEKQENEKCLPWLVRCICTTRNNLFHGGKYPYRYKNDESRNPILLEHCLVVLSHALHANMDVEKLFLAELE